MEVIRNLIFIFETNNDFAFLECCLAGGVDFENSRFSIFVCVALRAASILRESHFLYFIHVVLAQFVATFVVLRVGSERSCFLFSHG